MMNTRLWYIFMPLAFLLAASLLTSGCQKEVSVTGSADRLQSDDIVVRLRIGCPPVTRSSLDPIENEGEYTLGFTAEEHKINSLTLIMMRVVNGREVFEMARTVDISEMTDTDKDGYLEAEFELAGVKGLKHFYVGANMTPQHVGAFTVDDKVMILDTDTDGHNITGQLMTVDHNTGAGSDVLMTGTLTINGNPDIVIDDIATDGAGTQLIEKKDGKSTVLVKNPGDAIPEEERELIWERYQRSQHQSGRHMGTGIGLSIVSTILAAHHMEYGVDCANGQTIFWFEFPGSGSL